MCEALSYFERRTLYDFILVTPIYQGVDGITCWCVEKAHQEGLNFLWIPGTDGKGDALVARSRSIATTAFLEHGSSNHMIFLDSDIMFTPEDLKKLNDHQKAGYDIIGGLYPTRAGTDCSSYFWKGIAPKEMGVQEIQFLSTGFMGISKYALEKIRRDYRYPDGRAMPLLHGSVSEMRSYPFFEDRFMHIDTPDQSGTQDIWLSEDWDFNEKARSVGFKIYAVLDIQLGHQGNRIVTFRDVEFYKKTRALMEAKVRKQQEEKSKAIADAETPDFVGMSTEGAKS